jgi:stage II sporulation protein D
MTRSTTQPPSTSQKAKLPPPREQVLPFATPTSFKTAQNKPTSGTTSPQQQPAAVESPPIVTSKAPPTSASTVKIRVLIAQAPQLQIGSSEQTAILDADQAAQAALAPTTPYTVTPTANGIQIGDQQFSSLVGLESNAENSAVYVNGNGYRGKLFLINLDGQILAVNELGLEDYVASVTGSEMYSDWHIEALKAQSVAARSYAIVHYLNPQSEYYDLCNSEQCQVYKGLEGESETARNATLATQNQVLLDTSGSPVLSQYSASIEITQEAHQGKGMPQPEAKRLAEQGWNYSTILKKYYPTGNLTVLTTP